MKTTFQLFSILILVGLNNYAQVPNSWTPKANLTATLRFGAVGFSIGNKCYIGTGLNQTVPSYLKDLWEWDPGSGGLGTWTQKADLPQQVGVPSIARTGAVAFSIGNVGYIGTGLGPLNYYNNDFYEYNPVNNQWRQRASLPIARKDAVGFSIGDKGYIGTGTNGLIDYKDFYEYDTTFNSWTQKTDFGGVATYGAVGFSIGKNGYIGTGANTPSEFWLIAKSIIDSGQLGPRRLRSFISWREAFSMSTSKASTWESRYL